MKKSLLILVFLTSATLLTAQEKRLNAYGSYMFDDSFDNGYTTNGFDYYYGKVAGGAQWGAGLEFKVREDISAELLYLHQDATAAVNYYSTVGVSRNMDLGINYYLLGLNRYMKTGQVEPYAGVLLGAVGYVNRNPAVNEPTSATKFALGFRLGADIWVSDKVAIKLQAQFLSSIQGFGGGFYFGTGGSGAGVSTYSTITQFGLGGGLAFKI